MRLLLDDYQNVTVYPRVLIQSGTALFVRHDGDVANETIVSSRRAAAVVLGVAVLGALARFTPEVSEWGWIARISGASLIVGVVPGAVMLLAWRPRKSFDLLEWLGLSIGISCASGWRSSATSASRTCS